ncbi:hypothetical protein [Blastochloris sulfoviridis]|uniref:Uncharacterized protein n=1 Tax=Blastochloris sulfoviridis TaxID=50712 RepID=A0A5M6I5L0_9HYPH|nr:hypothetical protein [Blastochloris sulfoviridis]KAA5603089.1 hypothetical protein F1193_02350 [Blastochloris sulfoviridis]
MQEEMHTERLVKIQAAVHGPLPFAAALVAVLALLAVYMLIAWLIYALAVHAWPIFIALVLLAAWWISRRAGADQPPRHAAPASAFEREGQAPDLGRQIDAEAVETAPHPDGGPDGRNGPPTAG